MRLYELVEQTSRYGEGCALILPPGREAAHCHQVLHLVQRAHAENIRIIRRAAH